MSVKAAMLDAGTSNLKFHALTAAGGAACSSDLFVVWNGDWAKDIPASCQCKSRPCQKLFAEAATTGDSSHG